MRARFNSPKDVCEEVTKKVSRVDGSRDVGKVMENVVWVGWRSPGVRLKNRR